MNLFCVGLSHHQSDLETRERFAGHTETNLVLRDAGCVEALLLATCNRVEVYGASEKRISTNDIARSLVRTVDNPARYAPPFYRYEGEKCAQHLFRVASGLDSMVVGETEILGQAKKAYEAARATGAAGPYLHRLFQRAFRVAKQVRTRTQITRGSVSVGSIAVELAGKIFGDLSKCKILLVGAGETSERTARALVSRGVTDLRVTNRSAERAENLAQFVTARPVAFKQWFEQCAEVDIVITSTSSDEPLLTRDNLEPVLRDRRDRPLFIIDIAVPRNVEPATNSLDGVFLYDIDSLQAIADESLALRRQQALMAEQIIAQHVAEFSQSVACGWSHVSAITDHPSLGDTASQAL